MVYSDQWLGIPAPQTIEQMQEQVYGVNVANGWFAGQERTFGDDVALLHSEVSEMFEAYRQWGTGDVTGHSPVCNIMVHINDGTTPPCSCGGKPEGVGSEIADVFIRLLDTCERYNINLRAEYERKIAHNKTRGYKHGGKKV